MTLATHIVAGVAAAHFFSPNASMGLLAAWLTHYMLDAIPHWDYSLRSRVHDPQNFLEENMRWGKDFLVDSARIALDCFLGAGLSLLIFSQNDMPFSIAALGGIGGVAPDILQFLFFKIKREPLIAIHRLHIWCHAETHLRDHPVLGIAAQCVIIAAIAALAYFFTH